MDDKKDKKDPKRFERTIPPGPMHEVLAQTPLPSDAELCPIMEDVANQWIRAACVKKEFELTSGNCASGGGGTVQVDLVVIIDTSASMDDEASDLSDAAAAAISAAQQSCPSDLRVAWLGIEGTWPGTQFTQTYRDYLHGLTVPDANIVGSVGDQEDGAAAVIDISTHFDWRPGAARTIFYLGDEALEGGDPQDAADVTAANNAITAANGQGVKVFTYVGTGAGNPVTVSEYARLAANTGGQAFTEPVENVGGFQAVLEEVICGSGVEVCQTVEEPKIVPCLRLRWGDGPQDHLETEDTEILCITVCNPYSNVVLKDFTLHLIVTDVNNSVVPPLPDGTPSVQIKPNFMICFDDIPPCNPETPDQPSCVSREVVLINRGAIEGTYKVHMYYCFNACFTQLRTEIFELELVKS